MLSSWVWQHFSGLGGGWVKPLSLGLKAVEPWPPVPLMGPGSLGAELGLLFVGQARA